jgi:hypothetical protein
MAKLQAFNGLKVGQFVAEANAADEATSEVIGWIYEIEEDGDLVWVRVVDSEAPEVTSEYAFWLADGEPVPPFEDSTIEELIYLLAV